MQEESGGDIEKVFQQINILAFINEKNKALSLYSVITMKGLINIYVTYADIFVDCQVKLTHFYV